MHTNIIDTFFNSTHINDIVNVSLKRYDFQSFFLAGKGKIEGQKEGKVGSSTGSGNRGCVRFRQQAVVRKQINNDGVRVVKIRLTRL